MIPLASCLLPFMLHASAPSGADDYLRAIPRSSSFLARIPDLADLLETAEDSAWFRYLDRECIEGGLMGSFTDDEKEATDELVAAMDSVSSLAFFMLGDGQGPETVLGFVAQLDGQADELEVHIEETLFADADLLDVVEIDGVTVRTLREDIEDGTEFTAMYAYGNVFMLSYAGEIETLMAHVEDSLEALGDPAEKGIMANRNYIAAREAGSEGHVEFYMNLAVLFDELELDPSDVPMLEEVMEDLRSCYATVWLGSGQNMEMQFDVHHGTENVFSDILELLVPASDDLLRFVPRDSLMVASGGIDIEGAIDLVLDLMDEAGSISSDDAEVAMDAFADQSGVHILDDLLRLMTGDVISFGRGDAVSYEDLEGAFLMGLSQGDVFLDGVEDLLSALGLDNALETDEYDGTDVYTLSDETGIVLYATITDEFLAFCSDEDDLRHVIDASNDDDTPSILDSKRFATELEEMSGTSNFRLQEVSSMVEMFGASLRSAAETGSIDGADLVLETLTGHFDDTEVIARYFSGLFAYSMETDEGVTTIRFETL